MPKGIYDRSRFIKAKDPYYQRNYARKIKEEVISHYSNDKNECNC